MAVPLICERTGFKNISNNLTGSAEIRKFFFLVKTINSKCALGILNTIFYIMFYSKHIKDACCTFLMICFFCVCFFAVASEQSSSRASFSRVDILYNMKYT